MKKHPASRMVQYNFWAKEGEGDFLFDVEECLSKAKRAGVIRDFDDGRNRDPRFSGKPGPELRKLRDLFQGAARLPYVYHAPGTCPCADCQASFQIKKKQWWKQNKP